MQLQHLLTSRHLVQPVNVLGHHRFQLARRFQLGQLLMGPVGLCIQAKHFIFVKPVKFFRMIQEKGMAQNFLRRIVVFLMIQAIHAAEIRNAALRRYAGAAKKYNVIRTGDQLL